MKIEKNKLLLRVIVLPFVIAITFCYSMYQLVDYWINFMLYGGEFIALTKKRNRKSIVDIFDKLQDLSEKGVL